MKKTYVYYVVGVFDNTGSPLSFDNLSAARSFCRSFADVLAWAPYLFSRTFSSELLPDPCSIDDSLLESHWPSRAIQRVCLTFDSVSRYCGPSKYFSL